MQMYETFLEHHQSISPRIPKTDKDDYLTTFTERDEALQDFNNFIGEYFNSATAKKEQENITAKRSIKSRNSTKSVSTMSSKTESSYQSSKTRTSQSTRSGISSQKLKEETKQAELKAKILAFEKKKELEIAKTQIKLEEEELKLKTDIAISDAKTQILNKYENQTASNIGSEYANSIVGQKPQEPHIHNDSTYTREVQNRETPNGLNVNATPYVPRGRVKLHNPVKTVVHSNSNADSQDNHNDMISVVKHLRKPASDIRKFGGDPLEFRKFIRQFNARIVINAESEDEKMTYLEQYTYGEAHKVVSGYGQLNADYAYSSAIKQLHERYGNEEVIANAFIKKALEWPDIQPNDAKALDEFSLFLIECKNAIESMEAIRILEYSENIKLLMQKLPLYLHDRWRNIVLSIRDRHESVKINDFVEFVKVEARKLNDPIYGKSAMYSTQQSNKVNKKAQKPKQFQVNKSSCATDIKNETPKQQNNQSCTYCASPSHKLENCREILTIPLSKRQEHLRSNGYCYGCLKRGHRSAQCRNRQTCEICKKRHLTLLHDESKIRKESQNSSYSETETEGKTMTSATQVVDTGTKLGAGDLSCAMAIIPVKVKLKNKPQVIDTYAFFDPGSSVTFCTDELLYRLGGSGKHIQIRLNTMGEPYTMNTMAVSGLEVMDYDMQNIVELPKMYTKEKMPVSDDHIPKADEIEKWSHLSDIRYPVLDTPIGLLIGNNVADAYAPFEFKSGPSGSPHATRTRLGWIVWNLIRDNKVNDSFGVVNRAHLEEVVKVLEDQSKLESLVKESINRDFPERITEDKREDSLEDKKFIEIVTESIRQEHGHYVIALPFRNSDIKLPNNSSQCVKRLRSLKRKLTENPKFRSDYTEFMNKLLEKHYMEPVPTEMLNRNDGKVWYIPHHGVYHSKKPDKIRVVFDCSATYLGTSLNSQLLQGPDLTNNLLGVLLRFRQENVAILGDIEAMFHQVKVPPNDRDCLRFYWWPDGNLDIEPQQYRMTVHLFGATSSPSCCNFALRQSAQDYGDFYCKQASNVINNGMYVDDCLSSVPSDDVAIKLIESISSLCKDGGFHMTKWISNSPNVVAAIPEQERAKEVQNWTMDDNLPNERALGVQWFVETDDFGFNVIIKDRQPTRRSILSITSSVYDPLGIVSPFVLQAKSILQGLCKRGFNWDQELEGTDLNKWNDWLRQLEELKSIRLIRCYKPQDFGDLKICELHCFSDASDIGYGMVFYLRLIDIDGNIHCAFLLGKSRVAPLKKITVPRMELTAATCAVKLSRVIMRELDYEIDRVVFWTDSMSVIRYINNFSTRFHTFVANRLEIIRDGSNPEQWRYVNTKENPADHASRGMKIAMFAIKHEWLNGPTFLWKPETDWPNYECDTTILPNDSEVIVVNTVTQAKLSNIDIIQQLFSYFSNWLKMKRIVARLIQVIGYLRNRVLRKRSNSVDQKTTHQNLYLSANMLHKAELVILRIVQQQYFEEEINIINSREVKIKKTSKLYRLDPYLDDVGLLRVGGRLENSELSFDAKHPIILPKESRISKLILENLHAEVGHLGKNTILSELHKRFWIIGASVIIKGIISKCVTCRKYQGQFMEQKMSNLPKERLVPDKPPFTMVGIDFFGPFYIKQRRSSVKRYGMIFTCMTSRAVHLEVTHMMDTDSCINGVRRFIARRGKPEFIRSDNGTNLVGAERELREEIDKWNLEQLNNFMCQTGIEWTFNPPAGSHFGGIWERLIRSVRKILYSLMSEQHIRLDDEGLSTLMCEVEATLNNRPISDVSDNVNDVKALTPNQLLLLKPGEHFPPGSFSNSDNYAKRRWRQIQYLSDIFWKRWTSEYIPMLQQRQKWASEKRNVEIGDIVLIQDNTPRNFWNLGRVIELHRDKYEIVRSVKVKTCSTELIRPIVKLVLVLEADA